MNSKPFLKWAGGKRWLADRDEFRIPAYSGRYFEPFLGGGAIFFSHAPRSALLSDSNPRLIATYVAIKNDWSGIRDRLQNHHANHNRSYYYEQRDLIFENKADAAAQFLYLNRACWNGLYRESLSGRFNVPIGTKSHIVMDGDDFEKISSVLRSAELRCCDFEVTVDQAGNNDFVFVDPPYTVAHNMNGFVKYNEKIFSWSDQIRLREAVARAISRGAKVAMTNADHPSVRELYGDLMEGTEVARPSVISGSNKGRSKTSELLLTSYSLGRV